ncbi:MAG: BREX-6 system phosphatase PglZ, partial [Planctomycetota bacterium]|nr:BREX-6 system phosphatase PglZ [Planctomycetota bacterium]
DVGVQRFVFTSDHGFLLLMGVATTLQSHGRKIDPKRRHVISPIGADHAGEVRVPLRDLGYDCDELHLMMPATTAPFDTGDRPRDFVHGGNSLQERVIPVLTLVHRAEVGGTVQAYDLEGKALPAVAGMHCIEATLKGRGQKGLKFGGTGQVALGLRVVDDVEAEVKLCEARGGAKLEGGAIVATVAEPFEVFFRLSGPADARVRVELFHGGGEVDLTPLAIEKRFDITDVQRSQSTAVATSSAITPGNWLADLPEGGVRKIFEHLASHGAVTEVEAVAMLGNQRALRRFALQFEAFAARAPFQVSIENVAGEKRYVRTSGT